MDFSLFQQQLKDALLNNNAKKLILKLIDAPYRYESLLNPFDFKTKLYQSFLRTQENKYYKFITNTSMALFASYNYEFIDKDKLIYSTSRTENDETIIDSKRANFSFAFKNEDTKKIYAVLTKKRDVYSANDTIQIFDKVKESSMVLANIFRDYKIETFLWFIEDTIRKNEEYYHANTTIVDTDKYELRVKYGAELFDHFNHIDDWKQVERELETFKNSNFKEFLVMPDLDTDEEALESLVELSESAWEKLNSVEPKYMKIRANVFNQSNPNSNLFKALKQREIIQISRDEDELKNNILENKYAEQNNSSSE
ncbi:HpyAIV family type II restriction enzyme [Mycoplasmopsis adleri]|uniref:HpyAIV family type II restriction enzyme n=1 Tax=Mycoplasmopsis adleri TaxID=51362 RepID=UPI003872F573